DFEILGPLEKAPEAVEVLLVACRSENIDTRIAALELAGLTPAVMDVETYAMEKAFSMLGYQLPNYGRGKIIAVADMGATLTTINVLHDGKVIYTREQVFGGNQLTGEIQRRYKLSY